MDIAKFIHFSALTNGRLSNRGSVAARVDYDSTDITLIVFTSQNSIECISSHCSWNLEIHVIMTQKVVESKILPRNHQWIVFMINLPFRCPFLVSRLTRVIKELLLSLNLTRSWDLSLIGYFLSQLLDVCFSSFVSTYLLPIW